MVHAITATFDSYVSVPGKRHLETLLSHGSLSLRLERVISVFQASVSKCADALLNKGH